MDARRSELLAAARRSPARSPAVAAREWGVMMGTVAVSAAIFLAAGGVRPFGRPVALMAATATGAAVWAAAAVWLAFGRGRSMLGRPAWTLVVVTAAVPIALLAWKAGLSAAFDGMSAPWPARRGFRCLELSLGVGLVPLIASVSLRRRLYPSLPALHGAALGVAAGAWAWLLIDLWCPVGWAPHLLLGHLVPVALLALVGALTGARLLRPRLR